MGDKKDGGPAFPILEYGANRKLCKGMTLRDYFAGQALAGIISGIRTRTDIRNNYHHASDEAYGYADAMLAERDK